MVGRPPRTASTPLTDEEELYVQARHKGANQRQALVLAGHKLKANETLNAIASKARRIEVRPNVARRMEELGMERNGPGRPADLDAPPPSLKSFEPEDITPAVINEQVWYVYQQALNSLDIQNALKALQFLSEHSGNVIKKRAGRPAVDKQPNQGDVSGNYGDTNETAAGESQGFDTFFGDADTSDGDGDPAGDIPFFRASTPSKPLAKREGRERSASAPDSVVTRAGKPRASLSGGPTGE